MSEAVATTTEGPVQGAMHDGIATFLGVPYAASAEGRRFLPPLPAEPREGTFDATTHGHIAPQQGALVEGDLGNSRTVGPMPSLEQGEPSLTTCFVANRDLIRQSATVTSFRRLSTSGPTSSLEAPFDVVTPMGGSFNFHPRGAWTPIDAGYSPNTQEDGIAASPVVEILAAIGLEHSRPDRYETRKVRYAVWGHPLPPMLVRAALAGADLKLPMRRLNAVCGSFTSKSIPKLLMTRLTRPIPTSTSAT